MYGNMTREEMIQRLYEGNFTTGELERQLIAKLFEQCCGGGGSGSSGETFVVEIESVDGDKKFNKTAKEVFDACKTSNVIFVETTTETDPDYGLVTATTIYTLGAMQHSTDDLGMTYVFVLISLNQSLISSYSAYSDNDYPVVNK